MPIFNTPIMNYNNKKKEKTVAPVINPVVSTTSGYINRNAQQSPLIANALQQAKDNNINTSTSLVSQKKSNSVSAGSPNISSINSNITPTKAISPLTIYERAIAPSNMATKVKQTVKTSPIKSGSPSIVPKAIIPGAYGSSDANDSSNNEGNSTSSALAEQQARQAAAQNYYNNNLSALQNAYNQRLSGLQSNLASTQDLLKSNFNLSKDNLYSDAERALQEAYINRMMNERALQQQLNAQGLNGGATESAIASMLNNYGTSRNNINTTYNSNLAQLEQAYLNNLSQAQQEYNDAVAQAAADNASYRMELENALYRAMLG